MGAPGDRSAAIFVLPTTTAGQLGPVAGWISTSGWAAAAERELGQAWIVTPGGVLGIDEVRRLAAAEDRAMPATPRRARSAMPPIVKTLVKDAREAGRARRFHIDPDGPWADGATTVSFVWQRHELFHTAGLDLADALGVPSVLFVPALLVWQAERWAVRRPMWGQWLERWAEQPALERADLIACGTDVIALEVARLGIPEDRLIITPTGVDLSVFAQPFDRTAVRRQLGIPNDGFVIGWAGSFRPFHALEDLVRASAATPGATLLLVGDGTDRPRIERLAAQLGVVARFTGLVPHGDLPRLLAAMDVGVALGRKGEPFHYSPLKVAEYLAAGLAVVAPRVPQLTGRLEDGREAAFFQPGAVDELAGILRSLSGDDALRGRLAAAGRHAAAGWSWDEQVHRVRMALAHR